MNEQLAVRDFVAAWRSQEQAAVAYQPHLVEGVGEHLRRVAHHNERVEGDVVLEAERDLI